MIWKDIKGFESIYQISDTGLVKGLARVATTGYRSKTILKERIIKGQIDAHGYHVVGLYFNGNGKRFKVHRLVSQHFIDNPYGYNVVNHKNGIKTDNRVENLEWTSSSANNIHAVATGLRVMPKGGEHTKSRLIIDYNTGVFYYSVKELATLINVNHHTLYHWLTGDRKNKTSYSFI